jgi:hypothetical protein
VDISIICRFVRIIYIYIRGFTNLVNEFLERDTPPLLVVEDTPPYLYKYVLREPYKSPISPNILLTWGNAEQNPQAFVRIPTKRPIPTPKTALHPMLQHVATWSSTSFRPELNGVQ